MLLLLVLPPLAQLDVLPLLSRLLLSLPPLLMLLSGPSLPIYSSHTYHDKTTSSYPASSQHPFSSSCLLSLSSLARCLFTLRCLIRCTTILIRTHGKLTRNEIPRRLLYERRQWCGVSSRLLSWQTSQSSSDPKARQTPGHSSPRFVFFVQSIYICMRAVMFLKIQISHKLNLGKCIFLF